MASIKHAVAPPGQFRPHHSCRIETFNHSCSFAPDEANGTIQYNTTHYGQIRSVLTKPIHPVLHCPWSMTSSCHKEHTLLWNGSRVIHQPRHGLVQIEWFRWDGNLWMICVRTMWRKMGAATHSKEEKQYAITPMHLFSGRGKQWRKVQMWFLDQPLDCVFYLRTLPTLRKTCFSIFKSVGGVVLMFFRIGYCIGADLHVVM